MPTNNSIPRLAASSSPTAAGVRSFRGSVPRSRKPQTTPQAIACMITIAASRKASKPTASPGLDQTQTAHSQTSADTPAPAYRSARTERR